MIVVAIFHVVFDLLLDFNKSLLKYCFFAAIITMVKILQYFL
jgi:hypothetical protein